MAWISKQCKKAVVRLRSRMASNDLSGCAGGAMQARKAFGFGSNLAFLSRVPISLDSQQTKKYSIETETSYEFQPAYRGLHIGG